VQNGFPLIADARLRLVVGIEDKALFMVKIKELAVDRSAAEFSSSSSFFLLHAFIANPRAITADSEIFIGTLSWLKYWY
jgi:hypothetical protein